MTEQPPTSPDDNRPDNDTSPGRAANEADLDIRAIEISRHYLDLVELLRKVDVTPEEFMEIYKQASEDVDKQQPDD